MFLIGIATAAANARRRFAQAISSLVILPKGIARCRSSNLRPEIRV
jgi:hypothetical protein